MNEIWAVPDTDIQPEVHLYTWQIIKVKHIDESITSHLCGNEYWDEGRFSSAIESFDGKVYNTRSGRRYVVHEDESLYLNRNAEITRNAWIRHNNVIQVCKVCEMSLEAEHKMSCSERYK